MRRGTLLGARLHVHHSRARLVDECIALSNHLRGTLAEYGIVIRPGARVFTAALSAIAEDTTTTVCRC